MKEITRVCDEVIFLNFGKIVAQDTPAGLTKRIPQAQVKITFANRKTVTINTQENLIPQTIFKYSKSPVEIVDIEIQRPTLEDVFLQIARAKTHVPN